MVDPELKVATSCGGNVGPALILPLVNIVIPIFPWYSDGNFANGNVDPESH